MGFLPKLTDLGAVRLVLGIVVPMDGRLLAVDVVEVQTLAGLVPMRSFADLRNRARQHFDNV